MTNNEGWTTRNEINYIILLLSGIAAENVRAPQEILLKNYIRSAKKRQAWDTFGIVKAMEVIDYAEKRLAALTEKGQKGNL